ncbi:hypothetical protein TKK_0000263 [Trichogramma kaykai]
MSVEEFHYIVHVLYKSLQKDWCNLHNKPILPEEEIVITIRFLATGQSYVSLAFAFNIGVSTVSKIIHEVMDYMWIILRPVHMGVPTRQDFLSSANTFLRKYNIPNCIGAVDGKHVRIKKPAHSGSLYFNYKRYFSCVLQAVVDGNGKFTFIDICPYGSQSDGAIFGHSDFKRGLDERAFAIPDAAKLPFTNVTMPYYFIGDGAYPLRGDLLKPIRGHNLPPWQKYYNKRISRARVVVENAFGRLTQKWRIFHTTIQCQPDTVEKIIKATCILHNIILTDVENEEAGAVLLSQEGIANQNYPDAHFRQGLVEREKLIRWFNGQSHNL